MDNSLIQDLIQFREMLSDKQKYLERCSGMRKPNAELEATLSETVEEIKVQLDSLIAKHLADDNRLFISVYNPYLWRSVDQERLRRFSRRVFTSVNS